LNFSLFQNGKKKKIVKMVFGLGVLIEATVLFINAIAILNEERFLKPMGWGNKEAFDQNSFKDKIVSFISAVRMLMRSKCFFLKLFY
jgi:hypothetical protein